MNKSSDDWNKLKHLVDLSAENTRLKEEVEKLRKFNDEALAHIAKEERKSRERLDMAQAEVERLIKAGDAMASSIQFKEEMEQDYEGPTYVRKCVKDWNAAKEASQA